MLKTVRTPDPTFKTANGWMSPEGKLYPCEFENHYDLAQDLQSDGLIPATKRIGTVGNYFESSAPLSILEYSGWVKFQCQGSSEKPTSTLEIYTFDNGKTTKDGKLLTQRQLDSIFDYCRFHRIEPPVTVKTI